MLLKLHEFQRLLYGPDSLPELSAESNVTRPVPNVSPHEQVLKLQDFHKLLCISQSLITAYENPT